MKFQGRGIWDEGDYKLGVDITKKDFGYVRAGFTNYRKYFDDTGGYYKRFTTTPPVRTFDLDHPFIVGGQPYQLEENPMHLDIGDIYVEMGLTVPDFPEVYLRYEREYKKGKKSMVEWGTVTETGFPTAAGSELPSGSVARKIFPAFKDIDETVDIVNGGFDHTLGNVHFGDDFRWEHYSNDTERLDDSSLTFSSTNPIATPTAYKEVTVKEQLASNTFFNTAYVDSQITDNLYASAGYLFSSTTGMAGMDVNTQSIVGPAPSGFDNFNSTHTANLDQDSHVVNVSLMFTPFKWLTAYGGIQTESTLENDGSPVADLAVGSPTATGYLATQEGITDKTSVEGTAGLRFTAIPWTTLYAEGKWQGENYNLRQLQEPLPGNTNASEFERLSDGDVMRQTYTIGFNTSPIKKVTLSGQYRHILRDNGYDNIIDTEGGIPVLPSQGVYPGFLTHQQFSTDKVSAKIAWHPLSQVTTSFKYQLEATGIDATHYASSTINPGGNLDQSRYMSNVFSGSVTWTPLARLYLTGTVSAQDTATHTFQNDAISVGPYRGNVFSFLGTIGYTVDDKTDLMANYLMSASRNYENIGYNLNPPATGPGSLSTDYGLPLGLDYSQHGLTIGVNRRLTDSMTLGLNYGLFIYDEAEPARHTTDYIANMVGANLKLRF